MSRAAVLSALRDDISFNSLVPTQNIVMNYRGEGRPSNLTPGPFIVLRWGSGLVDDAVKRGPRELQVWVHVPEEQSTDYSRIDQIMFAAKSLLTALSDTPGGDGLTVTACDFTGESDDMRDPGFETIMRYMTFRVLSRPTQ